jgi:peptidoglycan hydrolase CwlO-like protein
MCYTIFMKKQRKIYLLMGRVFLALLLLLFINVFVSMSVFAETDAGDIQDDISRIEKKLKQETQELNALQQDLNQINSSLTSTQQLIQRVQNLLNQTEQTIGRKEEEISNLEKQLALERYILTGLIQEMYFNGSVPLPEVILSGSDFTGIFQENDSLFSTQEKMQGVIQEINDMRSKISDEKLSLEDTKKDHELLLQIKNKQKQTLVADKIDTQGDIEDQQTIISRLNKELSQLQSDLNTILGKSYNAKDIKDAVEFASKETNVPKGFLMGVLKMETNLGANVGGCTYAQVEDGAQASYKAGKLGKRAWATFQYRRDLFRTITKELGIDYRKQKVSCNPRGYVGTGGAMGVAQFMPDTWNAYKARVAAATGHHPPNPWNLTDGVMAMAKKLSMVPGVTSGNRSAWKKAAALYLGTSYAPYINGILYWADHYKELL